MRGWHRLRLLLAGSATLAVLSSVLLGPAPAAQAAPGDCTANGGVAVIVDHGALGLGIQRGCASNPSSGLAALNAAGFATDFVPRFGNQFVCRINGQPTDQTCVNTPPASAYWSYWFAPAGQSTWTYSSQGSTARTPPPGSVDAWRFGATDVGGSYGQPAISPADARGDAQPAPPTTAPAEPAPPVSSAAPAEPAPLAPAPPAPTTTAAAPQRSSSTAAGSAPPGSDAPPTPGADGSTSPSAPTSASEPGTNGSGGTDSGSNGSGTAGGSGTTAGPRVVDIEPLSADARTDSGGSAGPTILGVALVAALAGAGGFVAWRRRQQAE